MTEGLVDAVLDWYDQSARDLPWRRPGVSAWAVLVSEFMLQQTPVARVLPVYDAWLARWPEPAALASETAGAAVRAWGRLGYPRRALRLHQTAVRITEIYGGVVPSDVADLRSLPGVGSYTAHAVAAFAFGQRVPVVDTNVRRVLARAVIGDGDAGPPAARRDEATVGSLLPAEPARAARFSVALMELGAMICTARTPACDSCPLAHQCAWRLAGHPSYAGPRRASQQYGGTDRYVRGLLLEVLRTLDSPVPKAVLDATWPDEAQRERALTSLIADGFAIERNATYGLPE